jgi:hypothetical protein
LLSVASFISAADAPLDIGSQRELFVDRWLIDSTKGAVAQRLHQPHDEGQVMPFDKPWEGAFCAYSTIIKDGDKYRLYYRGKGGGKDGAGEVTCYAESEDGRHWTKPNLGLYEVAGTKDNNVILTGSGVTHNFSPFLDVHPGVPESERFKALAGLHDKSPGGGGLHAFASADGIHWRDLHGEAVVTHGAFDSQNLCFWSDLEQRYVCFLRIFTKGVTTGKEWKAAGLRSVARTSSTDFVHWTEPQPMKFQPAQEYHLYITQTQPYFRAPHLYIATAARFMAGRAAITDEDARRLQVDPAYYKSAKDCSDSVLMSSRDGLTYDQTFREALVRPSLDLGQWVSRSGYPTLNVVPTGAAEMSLFENQNYGQPSAHLHRYSMRFDGFASMEADYDGGEFLTKAFRFTGSHLEFNFSTSAAGFIRVEIQDESGQPIPGFAAADNIELLGNDLARLVRWKSGADFASLVGKTVRLRVLMKDADLYSLRFQ